MTDYLIEVERAKAITEEATNDAKALADRLPDGHAKLAALILVSKLVQATVILGIRRPAVPCRLDFVPADAPAPSPEILEVVADSSKSAIGNSDAIGHISPIRTEMTELGMHDRIKSLSDEMDANDEENREMQCEIDALYVKIDAVKETGK